MTERIALFIDGSNFHQTVKGLGFDIDYKRLLSEFGRRGRIVRAYYYTTIKENGEFTSQRPVLDWLDYNGFAVRTKPAKEFDDGNGRRKTKRNMCIEPAVDAMELSRRIDHAFLFSGDGDLQALIQALERVGVRVTVVSSGRTKSTTLSDELRPQADDTIDLQDSDRADATDRAQLGASRQVIPVVQCQVDPIPIVLTLSQIRPA